MRPHPHINLSTVTYLFEGAIEHRDSIGSHAVIEPGAINLMTAGSGIVHSERRRDERAPTGRALYGMQTWLALPDGKEEIDPAFDHVAGRRPAVGRDARRAARVLMGSCGARPPRRPAIRRRSMPTSSSTPAAAVPIDAEADERAVMLVGGDGRLDGRRSSPSRSTSWRPGHARHLSSARGGRVMLMGGGAFTTPRHVFWNFVCSSRERINEAKHDWKAGDSRSIPGDNDEFIPLPEVPKTVSYP